MREKQPSQKHLVRHLEFKKQSIPQPLKIYRDGRLPLYHIDAYRLEGISQDLGFSDYYEGDGVCIVEWPDFVEEELPKARLELSIYRMDEQEGREFVINGIGEHYKEIEEAVYENIMHG